MPNKRSDNVPSNNQSRGGRDLAAFVVVGACVNVCMGTAYLVYLIGKIF